MPLVVTAPVSPATRPDVTPALASKWQPTPFTPQRSEPQGALTIMKRVVTLGSDAIVLTLASPFLALYYGTRAIKKRLGY